METKDFIGLALLLIVIPVGIAVCCVSQRARDAAFLFMVAGTVLTEKLDINFVTRQWYRGTTRGFEFTFIDILAISVLVSTLLLPRYGRPRWYWPAGLGAMLLLFFYSCFSVGISQPKLFGLFELSKMFRAIILFLTAAWFVRGQRELALLVFGLCCAVCFEGALAIKERLLDGIDRVTGNLGHANSLSMYLCMAGPVLVAAATSNLPNYLRYFSMLGIGFATVAIVFTFSRAGIPIFALMTLGATALCVSWRITLQKVAVAAVVGLAVTGLLFKSWNALKDRFTEATLEQEYGEENSEGRGMYLRQARAIVEDRFVGVGLNNWSYWVSKEYGARLGLAYEAYDDLYGPSEESFLYAAPAHNLAALTIGELGVPGLLVFALVWLRWFQMGARFLWKRSTDAMHRLGIGFFFAVGGVFLQSITEWVYRQTQILLAFHVLMGALAGLCYFKRRAARMRPESLAPPEEDVVEYEAASAGRF